MTRSEILCFLLGVLCIMQISATVAAPATDVREGNNNIVDEIITKLKQLRQQNEGTLMNEQRQNFNAYGSNFGHPEEIMRVHRTTLDNLGGGYLLKRAPERNTALDSLGEAHGRSNRAYNPRPAHHAYYYPLNHAHILDIPKRNFDEIDRLSDFDKRNFDEIDRQSSLYDFKKRNFDEIDRMGSLTDF
ncbi:hypothetical protein PVAND_003674 [Polypedilum vanderplanki]|uniref:Orcokinin n=1 Tax=Polypedilum vanderplanki TaxID=319348 RepID=A0A9J6BWL4_POLVA|nr:hypothetical protein PVAND_003674 [Polypedilum vanderplanki]